MMMMMPTGFRFNPTDEELIDILERKVTGKEMPLHDRFIVERNVYELDPHDLQWDHSVMLSSNERYCYYMRETDSREVSGRGWWRATGHVKKIYANNKHVVGYKRPLTFLRFTDNERKRKNGFKTNWIMHEYSLDSNQTEWRLCKIKYKGKASVREELENIKKSYKLRNGLEANNSIMVMQLNFIGEKQQQQPQPFELDSAYEPYSEVSSSMGMQQFEFVCEQQQPQPIELDNLYEPYSEVSSSIGMQHQFDFGGGKHHQPQPIQIDSEDGVYEQNNMQVEVMDHEQQPTAQQSNASYDPILTHIANLNYYFDDQLEQPDSSEELFPSLWSF